VGSEAELREALQAELKDPQDTGEPMIVIDRPSPGSIHLYVIWSKWEGIEHVIRSRIILDAFESVRGEKEADDVTVSMGLTQEEADRLGLEY
jgi:hypothetical protein